MTHKNEDNMQQKTQYKELNIQSLIKTLMLLYREMDFYTY